MHSIYRSIMDSSRNPLRALPMMQRFQIMLVLSMMWTAIFCSAIGAWFWYGEIVIAHVLVAVGFLITGLTFQRASAEATHRDYPRRDGTAHYDDVWGA